MVDTPNVPKSIGSITDPRNTKLHTAGGNKVEPLDAAWSNWQKSKDPADLTKLMQSSGSILDRAITSYAPNSSPAVKSKAKVLAIKAFHNFDPKKGTKLSSHLYIQLQPLRREAGSYETLYAPERVRMDNAALNEKHNQFVDENNYEPNDEELADYSGLSIKRIRKLRTYSRAQIGEAAVTPESDEDMRTMPGVQQAEDPWHDFVYSELGGLDKQIYDLKTGKGGSQKPLTVSEIAYKLKITPSAVSQRLLKVSDRLSEGALYGEQ